MSASRGRYAALLMAAMVFAVCLLVPALMLRDSGQPEPTDDMTATEQPSESLSLEQRAELYSRYVDGELSKTALDSSALGNSALMNAMRLAGRLESAIVFDRGAERSVSSRGASLYRVSDGTHSIRFLEYFREWDGDWSNWLVIVVDVDTLDLYYCYYSAACEQNLSSYLMNDNMEVGELFRDIGSSIGMDEFSVFDSIEDSVPFTLDFTNSVSGEVRSYETRLHVYEDAASLLVDIRLELEG